MADAALLGQRLTTRGSEAPVWALLALGFALQLGIAVTEAPSGDMEHFRNAGHALAVHGLNAYGYLNVYDPLRPFDFRDYSYPPGLLPWFWLADRVPREFFAVLVRTPAIVADAVLACLVATHLTARQRPLPERLLAVGLIVVGPLFLDTVKSGQIDAVAIVVAVAAVRVWRPGSARGAGWAGLLIGVGALVKTVPLVILVPLLLTARHRSERVTLILCAGGVLVAGLAPFLLADPGGTAHSLAYSGFPGNGGWSLLLQPDLAAHATGDYEFTLTSLGSALQDVAGLVTVATMLLAAILIRRRRLDVVPASALVTALLLFTTVNFFTQYAIWVLPFALLAGEVRVAVAMEVAMTGMYLAYGNITVLGHPLGPFPLVTGHRGALFYFSYLLFLVTVGVLAVRMVRTQPRRVPFPHDRLPA